jgi:hypothetical protein
MGGHVTLIGRLRNAYKILVGKTGRKRPLVRPRCRWKDNVQMDFGRIDWEVVV